MRVLEKYTGEKTYMFPNGHIARPQDIEAMFPTVNLFTHVIETDENGEVCFAVENLSALRSLYNIDPALGEAEAIAAIEQRINTPPESEVSPEERIAAALEYQVLASLPDMDS